MSCFRRGWRRMFGPESRRCLLLGLDAAGKTTVLYQLLKKADKTVPTIGFNVEKVSIPPVEFFVWDVSGQQKSRTFWRHYYHGTNGVIFVVDSNDRERLQQSAAELFTVCSEIELTNAAILILANKMDLPYAASEEEIAKIMKLDELKEKLARKIHIQPTQANVGKGIKEGLEWLAENMKQDKDKDKKNKKGKGKGKDKGDDDEKKQDKVSDKDDEKSSNATKSSNSNASMALKSSSSGTG